MACRHDIDSFPTLHDGVTLKRYGVREDINSDEPHSVNWDVIITRFFIDNVRQALFPCSAVDSPLELTKNLLTIQVKTIVNYLRIIYYRARVTHLPSAPLLWHFEHSDMNNPSIEQSLCTSRIARLTMRKTENRFIHPLGPAFDN